MLVFFAALALSAVPKIELARENEHGLPGMYYGSMDSADFDGDGRLDLVLSGNFDTVFDSGRHSDADAARLSDRVRLYENVSKKGGAIRFRLKEERKDLYGSRGSLVKTGDFDGDKRRDFAVQVRNGDEIAAFLNRGKWSFEKVVLEKGFRNNSNSLGMFAIDVDKDGADDLVFASDGGNPATGLWYRWDRKQRRFLSKQSDFSHQITYGGAIALGDLDGDGYPELAAGGNSKAPFGTHQCENLMIGQLHRNNRGSFEKTPLQIIGTAGRESCEGMDNAGLWIADLDRDKKNDLIVAGSATAFNGNPGKNGQQYDFAVLFNDGAFRWTTWQHTGPQDSDGTSNGGAGNVDFPNIATGDLNGDGFPEVFIQGHRRDYLVRVDLNGDGNPKDNPYVFDDLLFVNTGKRSFQLYELEKLLPRFVDSDLPGSLKFLSGRPRFVGEGGQTIADFNGDQKNDLVFSGAELPFHTNGANYRDENSTRTLKTYVFRNTR